MKINVVKVATTSAGKDVLRMGWPSLQKFFKSIDYVPHKPQQKFHKSMARHRIMCAGARMGKSIAAGYEAAANLLIPNQRWWIVGDTYNDAEKEFRYALEALEEHPDDDMREWIKSQIISIGRNAKQGQLWIKLKNGSTLECKSADRPSTLLGEELDGVIFAEGSQLKRFILDKYIAQRLASRVGQLIIPTTPAGFDDLLHPLFERGQTKKYHPDHSDYFQSCESWEFKSIDNPHYPKEEYYRAKKMVEDGQLDLATFEEQYEGKFTSHSGRVYPMFNKDVHVCDPYPVPENWRCFRTMDVGLDCPTVCLWAHVDPYNNMVITDEYYQEGADAAFHTENIKRITGKREVVYTVIDPAANQRTAASTKSVMLQYIQLGLTNLIPGKNSVDPGLQKVTEYLRYSRGEDDKVAIAPKLFITSNCPNLIAEFQGYVWSRKRDGERMNKPIKRNDHGLDALRYLCMATPTHHEPKMPRNPHPDSFAYMYQQEQKANRRKYVIERSPA